jgi:hypothetical protein
MQTSGLGKARSDGSKRCSGACVKHRNNTSTRHKRRE